MQELQKAYEPKGVEGKIYKLWEESGFLNPDNLPKSHKKPFSIVIPPPNVTGVLHMGHALNSTVQDIIIRFKRMQGFKTLFLPGTDHAGIATQNVVEKNLRKEGISRHDLGKEKFIEKVWEWKEKYGNIILDQLKKLGASCDWSRTRFTMDQGYQEAVKETFLRYYKKGWIYQGERVINWCPRCQTSLSDLEIEYKEEQGSLWFIKYPLKNIDSFIVVATTRPETMLGDSAVAVNPSDKKYKEMIGKIIVLPIKNRDIPIIADRLVDQEFGTGAVKVTPAHDFADSEMGTRHHLEIHKVINEYGKMTEEAGEEYKGLNVVDCRKKIVEELQNKNLIEKTEPYTHRVSKCYRCDHTIEPIPSKQWFLKMDQLAKKAISAVEKGNIKFIPKKWEKIYLDWLKNIKDWCISRQLWWGHKIPVDGIDDVLDTWFSSALWPFATLGWPKNTDDLKTFYPTNVLVTARDIINLWVARMVFSGEELIGKKPFSDVYITATILTKDGKRMSKSLGTGIDPISLIEKYGADATRFGLVWQETGNQDIHFGEESIIAGKKFCNKIWNASRFVLAQIGDNQSCYLKTEKLSGLTKEDERILNDFKKMSEAITKNLEKYQFCIALQSIYDFFWHNFCDKYIETAKKQIIEGNPEKTKEILFFILFGSIKLLHPFIPFITEEIYQILPLKEKKQSLMIESWSKTK